MCFDSNSRLILNSFINKAKVLYILKDASKLILKCFMITASVIAIPFMLWGFLAGPVIALLMFFGAIIKTLCLNMLIVGIIVFIYYLILFVDYKVSDYLDEPRKLKTLDETNSSYIEFEYNYIHSKFCKNKIDKKIWNEYITYRKVKQDIINN